MQAAKSITHTLLRACVATFVLRQGAASSRAETGANQPGFSLPAAGGPLGSWPLRCQSDPKAGKDKRFWEMLRAGGK